MYDTVKKSDNTGNIRAHTGYEKGELMYDTGDIMSIRV